MPFGRLTNSFLVATFFNNFLPSNIGGDVIRIRDSARRVGSKTLATTVILFDRGVGLLGLVFVAASGATIAARMSEAIGPLGPGLLWAALAGVLAIALSAAAHAAAASACCSRPLRALHQEWVGERISRLTAALARFREAPRALVACFFGAIVVQAAFIAFYASIAHAMGFRVPLAHLAILVPVSFIVQMLPVSVNGLGVREQTFVLYLTRLGLPKESALAMSFIGAVLIMLFSTTGFRRLPQPSSPPPAGACPDSRGGSADVVSGRSTLNQDRLPGGASRLAALLLPQILQYSRSSRLAIRRHAPAIGPLQRGWPLASPRFVQPHVVVPRQFAQVLLVRRKAREQDFLVLRQVVVQVHDDVAHASRLQHGKRRIVGESRHQVGHGVVVRRDEIAVTVQQRLPVIGRSEQEPRMRPSTRCACN